MALAGPFIFNTSAKLSAHWFPRNERVIATSIGTNSCMIGIGIGFIIPSLFMNRNGQQSSEIVTEQILNFSIVIAILALISTLLMIIFFKSYPRELL